MVKQKCKHCDKVIEAVNNEQLKALMIQHLLFKHRDKIEIKEL